MQTNRLAALALTAALCLGIAACGSSDSDDASGTTEPAEVTTTTGADGGDDEAGDGGEASPEKAAFLEAADAICKASTDAINEQTAGLESQDLDDAAFEDFLKMAAEESSKQIVAVRELGFPEADADELDAAFTVFEEAFVQVAEDPANTLEYTSTPEFQEASTFLTDYGFEECGGAAE